MFVSHKVDIIFGRNDLCFGLRIGVGKGFGNSCFILKVSFLSGEKGIRTLGTLLEYTHFPGVRLRPLGHLSCSTISGRKHTKNF